MLKKTSTELPESLPQLIRTARTTDLPGLVAPLAGRLKIHAERRMLVVLGGCDEKTPTAIAFLPDTRIQDLERLGIGSFDDHLTASTTPTSINVVAKRK